MHDVLVQLNVVSNGGHVVKGNTQLMLCWRHFMVMLVHADAHRHQGAGHFSANVTKHVNWRYWEVTAFDTWAVAHVAAFELVT